MTIWIPASVIRVKVLGLAWRGDALLLGEVADSTGRIKGLRPLGGSIEFGETRDEALRREFLEELGCDVERTGAWHVFENLFEHEGRVGHEFVFAAGIRLADPVLYERDTIDSQRPMGCVAERGGPDPITCRPASTSIRPDYSPSSR